MLVYISHFSKCSTKFTIILQTVMFKLLLAWQLLVLMLMLVLLLRARDWDNCELEMLGGNDITISGARDHKTQHCAVPPPDPGYCITVIVPCPRRVPPHRPRSGQGWCTMGSVSAMALGIDRQYSHPSHQSPLRDDDESADMPLDTILCLQWSIHLTTCNL